MAPAAPAAPLAPALAGPLAHYLDGLTGRRTRWFAAAPGDAARPMLTAVGLHLPAGPGERAGDEHFAAVAHLAAHLEHGREPMARGQLKPVQLALVGLLEDARVEWLAAARFPGLRRLWGRFHDAGPDSLADADTLLQRLARCLLDPAHHDPHPWVLKGRRMFFADDAGRALAIGDATELRRAAVLLGNDLGQMRLQLNAREYRPLPRYRDDNAHLWLPDRDEPARAAEAFDPPAAPPSPEGERADRPPGADAAPARPAEAAAMLVRYPEWDRLIGAYRAAWCGVHDRPPLAVTASDAAADESAGDGVARRLLRTVSQRPVARMRPRGRERDGERLDADGLLDWLLARRIGLPGDDRVWVRTSPRRPRRATLVLVDASASSAAAADGGGSLLQRTRSAAWLLAQALRRAGDDCAVHAFRSEGRECVRYERQLDFGETLDASLRARLGGLQAGGSTRLGAALRHGAALLARRPAEQRLLLLVSDGEAHDIDVHDPRYLVEDARRAVLEAARRGVAARCLALDDAHRRSLARVFGADGFRRLRDPASLPRALAALGRGLGR